MAEQRTENETRTRVDEFRPLSSDEAFEVVRLNGIEELKRPTGSLAWSGLAAGLAIGFSVIAEAVMLASLPTDVTWSHLIADFGYTIGFILVVLGRFQLFTENTITPVLPILHDPATAKLLSLARNWCVVLAANLAGVSAFAAFIMLTPAVSQEVQQAVLELGRHSAEGGFLETVTRGVGAGFLIAALVWVLANVRGGQLAIVFVTTYVIALCGFAHVIAGTVEVLALVFAGSMPFALALTGFFAPALIGNVIGGTVLFTFIAYAQVSREV